MTVGVLRAEPSDAQWTALLRYVGQAVCELLEGGAPPSPALLEESGLALEAGCFVTWHESATSALRGCIGAIDGTGRPLPVLAANMARSATLRDPRFPPIRAVELDALDLSVSLLGPATEWTHPRDPQEILIGAQGLEVHRDSARGVLLPQVAVEWGYDGRAFLQATCKKAGLPGDAWQDPATRVLRFPGWERGGRFRDLVGDGSTSDPASS